MSQFLEYLFFEPQSMNNDFKQFHKLLFVDEVLIEAKLFDGSSDEEFLVDIELYVNIFENLDDLVVVHR